MEAMDFFIFLLGTITVMLGYYLTQLSEDLKELEKGMFNCQAKLPMVYVLKEDYKHDIDEIKKMMGKIYDRLETKK